MPNFENTPPNDLGRSGFRLTRTPATKPIIAHVLSENLVGCRTHFSNNRTIPCEAPTCDACDSGVGWRWHAYLMIILDESSEIVIFETTARASLVFAEYYQRHATLRGCRFKASRLNGRPNGRVLIQARPADLAKIHLPKIPPVEALLCHIWNVPEPHVTLTDHQPRPPFHDATINPEPEKRFHPDMATIPIGPTPQAPPQQPPAKGNGRPK